MPWLFPRNPQVAKAEPVPPQGSPDLRTHPPACLLNSLYLVLPSFLTFHQIMARFRCEKLDSVWPHHRQHPRAAGDSPTIMNRDQNTSTARVHRPTALSLTHANPALTRGLTAAPPRPSHPQGIHNPRNYRPSQIRKGGLPFLDGRTIVMSSVKARAFYEIGTACEHGLSRPLHAGWLAGWLTGARSAGTDDPSSPYCYTCR